MDEKLLRQVALVTYGNRFHAGLSPVLGLAFAVTIYAKSAKA